MEQPERGTDPFSLKLEVGAGVKSTLWEAARPAIERLLGFSELSRTFGRVEWDGSAAGFVDGVLASLGIRYELADLDRARVPAKGPCIVVANHPFGAAEGMVLASILCRQRNDVRLLVNQLLGRIGPLRDLFILVDPFGHHAASGGNARAFRQAVSWLRRGGVLAVFPAGEVASFDPKVGRVVERPWASSVALLAKLSKAPVLPVYFGGANGPMFHAAGLVHPRLRTALLARELVNKRGRTLDVRVGTLLSAKRLADFEDPAEMVAYIRERTCMLADRGRTGQREKVWRTVTRLTTPPPAPVAPAQDPSSMDAEVRRLPADQVLFTDRDITVCWARAPQISSLLLEIGRLREVTFRQAGEGTGKSIDLDEYDASYLHLFAYNQREREIVGAYRLGPTDEILAGRGAAGLYTTSLFRIEPELWKEMGPALEMGRSFVRDRYQRSASGLYALWRGIGAFIAHHPRYRHLFGPVSISNEYTPRSRELIVRFIRERDHMHDWTRWVRPRHPFSPGRRRASFDTGLPLAQLAQDIEDISCLVGDLEADRKGLPVLLRQYMKLGGKMLGFNVDPQFSRVLDGLILVDLLETDARTLQRYLGRPEASAFLGWHRDAEQLVG